MFWICDSKMAPSLIILTLDEVKSTRVEGVILWQTPASRIKSTFDPNIFIMSLALSAGSSPSNFLFADIEQLAKSILA